MDVYGWLNFMILPVNNEEKIEKLIFFFFAIILDKIYSVDRSFFSLIVVFVGGDRKKY